MIYSTDVTILFADKKKKQENGQMNRNENVTYIEFQY